MRTRGERRYLTRRYQNRQLEKWFIYNQCDDYPDAKEFGRWKNLSWRDCGRPKCGLCSGPRQNPYCSGNAKLTLQEIRSNLDYDEQLDSL